ncbi:hypothetical protein KCP71_24640 [Salmonella enterica subsp. enterica]|nr:hypothetical protein KCP71_24640 [Salmonella enterica subsp. enterica]
MVLPRRRIAHRNESKLPDRLRKLRLWDRRHSAGAAFKAQAPTPFRQNTSRGALPWGGAPAAKSHDGSGDYRRSATCFMRTGAGSGGDEPYYRAAVAVAVYHSAAC